MSPATLMRRALRLAERSPSRTSPNPPVGALVCDAQGRIVGEGFHEGPGSAHAEIVALNAAGAAARGGSLVVTLAPCTRHGRTPPCLDTVLAAGLRRVIVGALDPNPAEQPGSIRALRDAGIEVIEEVLADACADLIAGFATHVTTGRPRVTLKLAISLDGRVAAADGSSRWITGPGARRDVHHLRAASDAILVGSGTVLADDPALTVRLRGYTGPQPSRILVDPSGRVAASAAIFDPVAPTIIATTAKSTPETRGGWASAGAEVLELPDRDGRVDLEALLDALGARGMLDLFVEGGPTLSGSLIDSRLVDRFVFYLAPKLLGAHGIAAIGGLVIPSIDGAIDLQLTSVRRVGADLRLEGRFRR